MDASGNQLHAAGAASLGDMLKVNTTLTELNVSDNEIGMLEDGPSYDRKQHPTPEGPAALAEGLAANSSVTQVDVRSNNLTDADTAQLFIPIVDKPHFESFSGIPIKQIRDNAITSLDLKGADAMRLEACGGVILAHSLKTNTSVTSVSNLSVQRVLPATSFALWW